MTADLWRFNPIDLEMALREAKGFSPFPKAGQRGAWEDIGGSLGAEGAGALIDAADEVASGPVPSLPATLWLEFKRCGERQGFQTPRGKRRGMLSAMTLAECLEAKGRYLDPLLDVVWAICEESSWALPAHQRELTDMERPVIDLGVAMTALSLAEFDFLLGEAMDPLLGRRIRYEVNRRCFAPYLERHDNWWMYNTRGRTVNNWTAVCTGGVVGAALYLEPDAARKAEIVSRGLRSLSDYMETFDPSGGSTEGPGYWGYGFGYYTILGHLLEEATDGQISLWEGDHVRQIAQFPLRTLLSGQTYTNFSDCDADVKMTRPQLVYLSERLHIPDLMRMAREAGPNPRQGTLSWGLRDLVWRPKSEPEGRFIPNKHDWYEGMAWMIARRRPEDPDALVVAAKGGHNGEMHNQNDVGSVIVRFKGESIIVDPGRGRYTRAYFGPERYEHWVNSSEGHSVPIPNGQYQLPGKEHGARLLDHQADATRDLLSIEMSGAYPDEADLESLTRTVILHRNEPNGWVELTDQATFATGPGTLASALLTFGQAHLADGTVSLQGERGTLSVVYDADLVTATVETVRDVDLARGKRDIQRVLFTAKEPAQGATIHLRIEPA